MTIAADNTETHPSYPNWSTNGKAYVMEDDFHLRCFSEEDCGDIPWGSYVMRNYRKRKNTIFALDEKLYKSGKTMVIDRAVLVLSPAYKHLVYTGDSVEIEWKHPNRLNIFTFYLVGHDIIDQIKIPTHHCTAIVKGNQIELHAVMTSDELTKMMGTFRQSVRGKMRQA